MSISLSSKVAISPSVLYQEIQGEAVLLDLSSETYYGLNEVGSRIWRHLSEHADLRGLLASMQAEYDVPPDQLEQDLIDIIDKLSRAGLVTVQEAGAQSN